MASTPLQRSLTALSPPVLLRSKVIHGFGRGSKLLGFPTANMEIKWEPAATEMETAVELSADEAAVRRFIDGCNTGIYAALACVEDGPDAGVYKAAVSVGWNPTFTDVKAKTIEPWILHEFEDDFYECHLKLMVLGYIRPELKFTTLDALIAEIKADGEFTETELDKTAYAGCTDDPFFQAKM